MPVAEKSRISREISGLLFSAEATALHINNHARILCLKIKNHAHLCSQNIPPQTPPDDLWRNYEELESQLRDHS